MRKRALVKTVIIYVIAIAVAAVLFEAMWGTTGGILAGLTDARDKSYQEQVSRILRDAGISDQDFQGNLSKLPPSVQKKLTDLTKNSLKQNINWFVVTFFVSAFVFAIVGFMCAFLTRNFLLIGLLPALSFFINNPLVRFDFARELSFANKLIIIVFAQFGFCYLFGYFGARLGKKRDNKLLRKD